MQLLADELVVRRVVSAISDEAVRRTLKKNGLKPWFQEHWCIPETSPETGVREPPAKRRTNGFRTRVNGPKNLRRLPNGRRARFERMLVS